MSTDRVLDCFPGTIARDFFLTMVGRELGSGVGRTVFESRLTPGHVIKVETPSWSFQNVMEWETWQELEHAKGVAEWLTPCVAISPCGCVLVMERTEEPRREDYPAKLPTFLTDTKRSNYGLLNGRLVCHDYGLTRLMTTGATKRLRKVEWWDG